MGQKCSTQQEVRYLEQEMGCVRDVTKNWETELRLNPNFEVQCPPKVLDYVQGTVRGGQEVTTSTPNSAVPTAAPAQNASPHQQPRQAMDYVTTWSNPFINSENKIDGLLRSLLITPKTSSNAAMHLAQAQCGGSAPSGILPHSSLNPSSAPGNGSSKRAMNKCGAATAQKSYQCVPSRAAAVHPPQNHAFPTQQGELLSTSQQPLPYPTAQGPVGQNTQGAANQTDRRGLAMPPPYVSPETKSRGTGEAVKHVMANHAPNRPSASGSDIGSYPEPSVGTSAFPSQAVQPGKQPCRDQTAGNLIIGSESQELSATPRPVNTLTAGNESCTGNQPAGQAEAQQKSTQTSFADDSVKAECRKAHEGTSGTESLQNGSTHLSNAAYPSSEPLFKPPKVSSQPKKSPGSSTSQKAVAVVPPLSPQAWDPAEETSSISHMEGDLPCKILSVISLNAESAAGLFDMKMTDTAFESLLVSKRTGEKNRELAVPHQQKTSQTSGSTCQVIPPAPGDSATEKIDPQTSNQQKSDSTSPANLASPPYTEDTPPSGIHSHVPGGQTGVAVHENRDQDGDLEKAVFDLSSVAITEWTTTRLVKLISLFHQIVGTPKQEMDVKKTAKLYGLEGYHDLVDVFSSDLYQSIMAEARSVCRESENSVVFSQIKPKSLEAVAKNCQILKHQPVLPSEEECELVKPSQAEKGKIVRTENVMYRSNRNTPLSMPKPQTDAPVGGTVDALSFIKITVLPPEEARRIFAGEESKVVKLEDPQSELPAQEGQGDETRQMEVELSQRRPEEQQDKEKQVDVSCCPFHWMKVTTSCKNSFCTFKLGQGGEEESKIDPSGTQMEKGERVELIESSVGGDCSPAAENNTISVHEPETTKEYQPKEDLPKEDLPKEDLLKEDLPKEDQHIETKAPHLSECAQSRPADDSTQEEGNSTEGEAMVSSGEPEEGRGVPGPSECSSSEILFDPDIILHEVIIPAPNVSEVESENVHRDCEETLKMAVAMSEQLWNERIAEAEHPILLQTNVDEVPTSGSEAEVDMALGSTRVGSQGEVPNQLPVSMDIRDLERRIGRQTSLSLRQRLHKRLSSTEKHDHEDEDDRRGEKECKRRCLEKSLCSTSPVREPSPQSVKDRERKEAVTVLKGTEDSHHNREQPLLAKHKGDHSASPESKPSCAKSQIGKDTFCSKGKSHGMVSAPFPPHVTFQDYKRRHMAKHKN
ncbi:hypothetical protein SKAU_G00035060 [Synaphobranchus kaupii]|uniref:Uncharacterized protein n=1 Tax=Synaphobranchus kaupii TaxID=118154 RepID=A0A9Q1GFS9_SYNKA|nr:hypothetical protein SKAU_G00035060 [Synaphobranchus kaupii]